MSTKEEAERSQSFQGLEQQLLLELGKKFPDRETVLRIVNTLKENEDSATVKKCPQVEQLWKKYKTSRDGEAESSKRKTYSWARGLAAVAAVLCLVIGMAVPVMGTESVFTMLGRWTEDVFEFWDPTAGGSTAQEEYVFETEHPGLQQIYDTVASMGITQPVVPTWLPEGYELRELKVTEIKNGTRICADFLCLGDTITFFIDVRPEGFITQYSKDIEQAGIYEFAGITHYLLNNDGTTKVVWCVNNLECYLSVCDQDLIIEILRSIYQ